MNRRRQRLFPPAPDFLYKAASFEPYNSAKYPEKPLATGAFCPDGVKNSLPELYQFLVGMVAPQVRLELTTLRLTAECSAIELLRNIFSFSLPLCYSLMFESGKNFRSSRSPLDPGNFLLSQAVPSSVPSAFGGLTSVFGMGTGGALQLSSPETFRRGAFRFLSASLRSLLPLRVPSARFAPPPRTFKTAQVRVDQQTYTLFHLYLRSSPRPISIGKLHASQRFHRRPIYLIVSEGSYLL